MFNLRCTKRLLDFLGVKPEPSPPAPTTILGDWYANLAPLQSAGDMVIFANERSLLTVALPLSRDMGLHNIPALFLARVVNLFHMLEIPEADRERELRHMEEVRFAKTASRKVLGSLNDICFHYDARVEYNYKGKPLSLSEIELDFAHMPHSNLSLVFPDKTARALLSAPSMPFGPIKVA